MSDSLSPYMCNAGIHDQHTVLISGLRECLEEILPGKNEDLKGLFRQVEIDVSEILYRDVLPVIANSNCTLPERADCILDMFRKVFTQLYRDRPYVDVEAIVGAVKRNQWKNVMPKVIEAFNDHIENDMAARPELLEHLTWDDVRSAFENDIDSEVDCRIEDAIEHQREDIESELRETIEEDVRADITDELRPDCPACLRGKLDINHRSDAIQCDTCREEFELKSTTVDVEESVVINWGQVASACAMARAGSV